MEPKQAEFGKDMIECAVVPEQRAFGHAGQPDVYII